MTNEMPPWKISLRLAKPCRSRPVSFIRAGRTGAIRSPFGTSGVRLPHRFCAPGSSEEEVQNRASTTLYRASDRQRHIMSEAQTRNSGPNPGDRADRLSRLGQDHPAQPDPLGKPRQALCGHRQRVRRDRHRQRSDRGIRRGDLRDEQWLRLLHRARRPDPRGRRPDAPSRPFRRHRGRDHRPGRPRPGRADLLHGRRRALEDQARCGRRPGRRQAPAVAAEGFEGGRGPDRLRRRGRAQQDRPRYAGGTARRRSDRARHQPVGQDSPHAAFRRRAD